jgi:hypothetical protein
MSLSFKYSFWVLVSERTGTVLSDSVSTIRWVLGVRSSTSSLRPWQWRGGNSLTLQPSSFSVHSLIRPFEIHLPLARNFSLLVIRRDELPVFRISFILGLVILMRRGHFLGSESHQALYVYHIVPTVSSFSAEEGMHTLIGHNFSVVLEFSGCPDKGIIAGSL